jgi:hypothetical protein
MFSRGQQNGDRLRAEADGGQSGLWIAVLYPRPSEEEERREREWLRRMACNFGSSGRLDGLFEHLFGFLHCSITGLFEIQPLTARPTFRQ